MSRSPHQQTHRKPTGKKSDKAGEGQALYGVEMDVKALRSIPLGTIPSDSKVLIVGGLNRTNFQARFAGFKKAKLVEFTMSSRRVLRQGRTDLDPPHKIKEKAFEPGARARALLRGAKAIAEDLEASGGTFDLDTVCGLTHLTRQGIHKQVSDGRLLAVPGPSNRNVYPVAQFRDDGRPVDGLKEVREALGTKSPWMLLNFLVNDDPRLDNRKPIDLLKAGKLDPVVQAAHHMGNQGA